MVHKRTAVNDEFYRQVKALPKVELHAHLSGSITQKKLNEMLEERGEKKFELFDVVEASKSDTNEKVFDYFINVYRVLKDLDSLQECTEHILEEFHKNNCIYLEIRTEPKPFFNEKGEEVTTPYQYIETVEAAINKFHAKCSERKLPKMMVRLILSIKRDAKYLVQGFIKKPNPRSTENSRFYPSKDETDEECDTKINMVVSKIEQIQEFQRQFPELIVGVDICGNPDYSTVAEYIIPALEKCQMRNKNIFKKLPITFHAGEVEDDEECDLILDKSKLLNVKRLGHCSFFKECHIKRAIELNLGIEFCPTSNLFLKRMQNLDEHYLKDWIQILKYKENEFSKRNEREDVDTSLLSEVGYSINTDDAGWFYCDLTSENYDIATALNLTIDDLKSLTRSAISSAFVSDEEKQKLLENFLEITENNHHHMCPVSDIIAINEVEKTD